MFGILVLVPVALVAGVLGLAALRPRAFAVSRTLTVQAPPEAIHPLINDFRRWAEWSPYEKLDAEMTKTYTGAAAGTGAVYTWEGRKAGAGRMEIRDTSPTRITIQLDFSKPFEAHHTSEFTLEPRGGATQVTWAMRGPSPFASRLFGVFVNLDRLIGRDFEAGLAAIREIAERHDAPR